MQVPGVYKERAFGLQAAQLGRIGQNCVGNTVAALTPPTPLEFMGIRVYPGMLDSAAQRRLLKQVRQIVRQAPLITQSGPGGRKMSVRMTSAGRFGWLTDGGYHYAERHPHGQPWPAIPDEAVSVWDAVSATTRSPECCLVNFYDEGARMGLHQDRDEGDFDQPVVSISLGDDALFRVGGRERSDPTKSIWLKSGDVAVLTGESRLAYHGIDRIRFRSSSLLRDGGRLNLTLRVVT